MEPAAPSRGFAAATDAQTLDELRPLELLVLEDGHIGGLNGVLLGVAAEERLPGACLLGEMPSLFHQLPFPKASLAVLQVFTRLTQINVEMQELAEQAEAGAQQLSKLLDQMRQAASTADDRETEDDEEDEFQISSEEEPMSLADRQRIERLFDQATLDRSKAFELKQELDRLGLFKEFEDRFLDLFKKAE
jgi:uncharacterized protein